MAPRVQGATTFRSTPTGWRPTATSWRCRRADPAATLVRPMTVENSRSVPWAANAGWPDMEVTRANETMTHGVAVFVGRTV